MRHFSLICTGEVVQHVPADAYIEVPRMVDRDLAARAGTSAPPFNRVETSARVAILKHLREAEKDINQAFLVIWRKNTGLYPQVKAKNSDEWATVSLSELAYPFRDAHTSWIALWNSCRSCKPTDLHSHTTCIRRTMLWQYSGSWRW